MGIHLELLTFWSDGSQTIPKLSYNFVMGFLQIDDHNINFLISSDQSCIVYYLLNKL